MQRPDRNPCRGRIRPPGLHALHTCGSSDTRPRPARGMTRDQPGPHSPQPPCPPESSPGTLPPHRRPRRLPAHAGPPRKRQPPPPAAPPLILSWPRPLHKTPPAYRSRTPGTCFCSRGRASPAPFPEAARVVPDTTGCRLPWRPAPPDTEHAPGRALPCSPSATKSLSSRRRAPSPAYLRLPTSMSTSRHLALPTCQPREDGAWGGDGGALGVYQMVPFPDSAMDGPMAGAAHPFPPPPEDTLKTTHCPLPTTRPLRRTGPCRTTLRYNAPPCPTNSPPRHVHDPSDRPRVSPRLGSSAPRPSRTQPPPGAAAATLRLPFRSGFLIPPYPAHPSSPCIPASVPLRAAASALAPRPGDARPGTGRPMTTADTGMEPSPTAPSRHLSRRARAFRLGPDPMCILDRRARHHPAPKRRRCRRRRLRAAARRFPLRGAAPVPPPSRSQPYGVHCHSAVRSRPPNAGGMSTGPLPWRERVIY